MQLLLVTQKTGLVVQKCLVLGEGVHAQHGLAGAGLLPARERALPGARARRCPWAWKEAVTVRKAGKQIIRMTDDIAEVRGGANND